MILKALFARDSLKEGMLFLQNSLHKHPSPLQKQHTAGWLSLQPRGSPQPDNGKDWRPKHYQMPIF